MSVFMSNLIVCAALSFLLDVHALARKFETSQDQGRIYVERHTGIQLDVREQYFAQRHSHGEAAIRWLRNATEVIPELLLPPGCWAEKLVVGYAAKYDFLTLKPLIYGFLKNVDDAWLVLLTDAAIIEGLPDKWADRIKVQQHAIPKNLTPEQLPYAVSLRFYIASAFLHLAQHLGSTFFVDTRDVFLQRDPFQRYPDSLLHFPRESSAYRLRGPFTHNKDWLLNCYGGQTLSAIGGNYVLNSGTLLGPSVKLAAYFEMMLDEFERRWHCLRAHGSDQVVHNYLVYTAKLATTDLEYVVDDQITGGFAFLAYTHPAVYDFRWVTHQREEMYNAEGAPLVAIHMWPGDNRAAKRVVLPFVEEYEANLTISPRSDSSPASEGSRKTGPRPKF